MTTAKRGLGSVYHAGKEVWGKGATAGDFVFLSGVEGIDETTGELVPGIRAQTHLALDKIKKRLEEAETSVENAVKFVWYLADRAMVPEFAKARNEWLEKNAPSLLKERSYAGTLLIVSLARHNMLIEIDCIAYVPKK